MKISIINWSPSRQNYSKFSPMPSAVRKKNVFWLAGKLTRRLSVSKTTPLKCRFIKISQNIFTIKFSATINIRLLFKSCCRFRNASRLTRPEEISVPTYHQRDVLNGTHHHSSVRGLHRPASLIFRSQSRNRRHCTQLMEHQRKERLRMETEFEFRDAKPEIVRDSVLG